MIGYTRHMITVTEEHRIRLPADAGEVAKVIGMMTDKVVDASSMPGMQLRRDVAANRISMDVEKDELVLSVQIADGEQEQLIKRAEHQSYVGEVRRRLMEITRAADDLLSGTWFSGLGGNDLAVVRAKIGLIKDTSVELSRKGGA